MKYLILFILITNHCLFGQKSEFEIFGKIIDSETSEPLAGATVTILESEKKTNTDMDGNFHIRMSCDKNIIKASFLSYESNCLIVKDTTMKYIVIKLIPKPVWMSPPEIIYYHYNPDSVATKGEFNAESDVQNGVLKLLQKYSITEVQEFYSKKYSFSFFVDENNYNEYLISYNEIVLKELNRIYGNKILEILNSIDWKNY